MTDPSTITALVEAALSGDRLAVCALHDYALECGRSEEEARAIGNRCWWLSDRDAFNRASESTLAHWVGRIMPDVLGKPQLAQTVRGYGRDPSPWLDATTEES